MVSKISSRRMDWYQSLEVTMVTFLTEGEPPNLYLRINDREEDKDTILAAYPPLYRGCCPPWAALRSQDSGGDMSWNPMELSRQYALVGRAEWINFWSALPQGYKQPWTAESDRTGPSSLPCYPRGYVSAHGSPGAESLRVFTRLGVPSSLVDEGFALHHNCPLSKQFWLLLSRSLPSWVGGFLSSHLYTDEEIPPGPSMVRYSGVDRCMSISLLEAYRHLDKRTPYRASLRPSLLAPQVFTDDQLDSKEDMAFFLSLRTNMVGYREDAYFLLDAYNPHRFSNVFSAESVRSAPLGPGKGKSMPQLLSYVSPSLSKPLKKCSLPEDDSVDRDPKHAKWGTTRRPSLVVVSSPAVVATITKDAKVIVLSEIVPPSEDEVRTEVVDSDEPSDCMVTGTTVVDVEEPSDCMITEAAAIAVFDAFLFTGVQRIESILRGSLRAAWAELCSFVEGKSHKNLLAEEGGIMASFEALTKFSRQDLSRQGKELKVVFSAARDVRDAQCSVVPSEVRDRLTSIRTASGESSSKLQHETEASGSVRTSLQQTEEGAIRLRQEFTELDVLMEDLRCQVTIRGTVITGLEDEQVELALKVVSLEESIETGR
ncbi:hypothetical protein LIER_28499 [Lithospermum erythrorhizon]|uniref:Aminotransferase-like plant mobile domain-containing protein n=1 Tax=Lithospermum erythrorhizon TaxID=34254 RepID=A0AAV3RFX7_LITER